MNVTFAVPHVRIRQCLDLAVADGETGKDEGHFDDELEDVGEGKESEEGVFRDKVLVEENPYGSDCGNDVTVGEKDTLRCSGYKVS